MMRRVAAVVLISQVIIFSMLSPINALTSGGGNPLAGGEGEEPLSTIDWKTLGREHEPVVVTANQVPDLIGTSVNDIDVFSLDNDVLVYAWDGANSAWKQIPFQVDERNPVTGSWAVDNANSVLDGYDEIVFMSQDTGDRASSNEWVVGCDAPRYEVEVVDPDTGQIGWAYIYKSSRVEADFTEDYVSFDTSVNDVFTESYSMGFRDGIGMIMDYFNVTEANGGDGEDLVDTFEIEASATVLWITNTYDENNLGADFTRKKDGDVRALGVVSWHIYQSQFGITVDAYLNFTWKFYPEHVSVTGHIKFDINGGVTVDMWLALDHISTAIPMDYRDLGGNTGVINGITDDNIIDPSVQDWWEVSSPHGGYVCLWNIRLLSSSNGLKFDDDSTAQDHDNAEPGLYGRTGAYFDDIVHDQETFATLSFYPLPSDVSGVAEAIMHNVTHPLMVAVTAQHSPTIWVEKSVDVHYAGPGYSHIWVNVPHIDANSDTDYIWMYYDNPDATYVQDESGNYDDNYVLVQHLQEKSGTHYDSTSYGNDGTPLNEVTQDSAGKIDGADYFDGIDDYIDCGNDASLSITDSFSVELWFLYNGPGSSNKIYHTLLNKNPTGTGNNDPYHLYVVNTTKYFVARVGNGSVSYVLSSDTNVDDGKFHHGVLVFDNLANNYYLYLNGVLKDTQSVSSSWQPASNNGDLIIGKWQAYNNYYNGTIDEARISNTARSSDWIKAQYLSMINDFVTFGDEEVVTWNPSWSCRKKLTFDNSGQSEALVNFPVLVNLSLSNFDYSKAKLDGIDLRYVAADNVTELKYHIEFWDTRSDLARYTIFFNNTGDRIANAIWINDTLPAKATFIGHDADVSSSSAPFLTNFNQIGKKLHFEFQDVPQGVHYFNITVTLNPDVTLGEIITNWAFCNFTNNVGEKMPESSASASFEVLVNRMPDIQVAKSVNKVTALPGEILQYTIYFNNTGRVAAETVWINDTLPSEVNYLSDSSATELGIKTGDYNWIFTDVAPGNHLFVINISLGTVPPGTNICNIISLEYTSPNGIMMPSSHAWANITIAPYTILRQGWNLISIPFIQSDKILDNVLSSIDGLYNAVQWYDAMDTNDHWKHNKEGKLFGNDLLELDETKGFWIHITQPGDTTFLYNGTTPTQNQTIPLHPGWNMVGYPSLTSYNRTEGLNNLTFGDHVDAIWSYNAATQKWEEMGESDYFKIGRGYYTHAKSECEWEVPL